MDVRCERCGSEYEFDEARIPEGGLPVKCSSCDHVFRVQRPEAGQSSPETTGEWVVRQKSGNTFTFRELTTLQRWIVERKVQRDDEISKTGRQWKRLGDIAELATFFQVVEAQPPAGAVHPQSPLPMAAPPYGAAPPVMGQSPAGVPMGNGAYGMPGAPTPMGMPGAGGAAWEQAPQPVPQAQPTGAWQMDGSGGGPDAGFDDEFMVRRGGAGKWVLLVVLLLVAGAVGAVLWSQPAWLSNMFGGISELAVTHVSSGYQDLALDNEMAIERAIENFQKAIAIEPGFMAAHAGLAEAELTRAEHLAEEAETLEETLATVPEDKRPLLKAELERKRRESSQRSERAFSEAKEALTSDPNDLSANRAMADYYRFRKADEQMKPLIEKARTLDPNDARVNFVLGASVADDPAAAERAIRYFDKALEASPELQAARYELARVYRAQGQTDKAIVQLERIVSMVPEHERATALLAVLKPKEADSAAEPPTESSEATKSESEATDGKGPVPFERLMSMADRTRRTDRPGKAIKLYEQAIELEPADPEAHVGVGWCYVDLEQPGAAISSFKSALRLAPRMSDAHMGLGEAYRMRGNKAQAIDHYQTYLDIMPNGPEAPVARRMIKLLNQ